MKKFLKVTTLVMAMALVPLLLSGCSEYKTGNRVTWGKDVQTFTYCYIVLDGKEVVKGAITQWRDYDNSDVVQILVNGKYYLTHYSNVVMIADPEQGALAYGDVSWSGIEE